MMYDPKKLQCFTMAARLYGYADGLAEDYKNDTLVLTLRKAADMLQDVWEEYQQTLPPDKRI